MFLRRGLIAFLAALSLLGSAELSFAEKRVALVIGNSAYRHAPELPNPANDASSIAALLKSAGFDVVQTHRDLGIVAMRRTLREFTDAANIADIAVVFFAGHGIEVDGINYLVPTDAKLDRDFDVEDEAISLDRVLKALEPVRRLRLVILDSCRENPFVKTMRRSVSTRAVTRGLARVEPSTSDTLIAFAAKAGSLAADGSGANSPFTTALLQYIAMPGIDVRIALGKVRDQVIKSTAQKQEPFVYGSLGGETVSLVPLALPVPVAQAAPPVPAIDLKAEARRDYEFAAAVGTKEAWDYFLAIYTSGFYADLARAHRSKIIAGESLSKPSQVIAAVPREVEADTQKKLEAAKAKAEIEAKAKADADAKAKTEAVANAKAEAKARVKAEAEEKAKVEAITKAKAEAEAKAKADADTKAKDEAAAKAKAEAQAKVDLDGKSDQPKSLQVAAVPQQPETPSKLDQSTDSKSITRKLQLELMRVGCHIKAIGSEWNTDATRALEAFNKNAKTKLEVKVATTDALEAVQRKTSRVCPLICNDGFRAEGEKCVREKERSLPTARLRNERTETPAGTQTIGGCPLGFTQTCPGGVCRCMARP